MKIYYHVILIALITCFISSCNNKKKSYITEYNENVTSYTSGTVSRNSDIEITFKQPIAENMRSPQELAKCFAIKPQLEGNLKVTDDMTLTFHPSQWMERGKTYKIAVQLDKLLNNPDAKKFKTQINTIEPGLRYEFEDLSILQNKDGNPTYQINGIIQTADVEDTLTVKDLLEVNKDFNIQWLGSKDAQTFHFALTPKKQIKEAKEIKIETPRNSFGYPHKTIGTVVYPDEKMFDLYLIRSIQGKEEYAELIFTRDLDPQANYTGIIEIEPNDNYTLSVDKNKLKIWFKNKQQDKYVVKVHDGIYSKNHQERLTLNPNHKDRYIQEISFSKNYPNISFANKGNIIPVTDKMIIPFKAIGLRGVIVRVIRVYENNMGQFLQDNRLDGGASLAQVGNLLCRKLIFFENAGQNVLKEQIYALNLNKLVKPEPGALYQVRLSFNYDLSAYPGLEKNQKTKSELLKENNEKEKYELEHYGDGTSYYYFNDQSYEDYNWEDRNDPCKKSYYTDKSIDKNILASNIGIIAKRGDTGNLLVSVHDIQKAKSESGVNIDVYTFQHQKIGSKKTDKNGFALIEMGKQQPFYLIATNGKQRGYLRLVNQEALSMSAFDVSGEVIQNNTNGFIYTERGVWRPGDSIFVSFILNNTLSDLPHNYPITCELVTPFGQVYWKKSVAYHKEPIYCFTPITSQEAPTGLWKVRVIVGNQSFIKNVRIETIKPNRLSIDLTFDEKILQRATETKGDLHVQWLTGAKASFLNYEIQSKLIQIKTSFKGYELYTFDDPSSSFKSEETLFAKGKTDQEGNAKLNTMMMKGSNAPGMLVSQFLVKVMEPSGDLNLNTFQKSYSPYTSYVGIYHSENQKNEYNTNENNSFNVASVLPDGTPAGNKKLAATLYRIEWYWWWSSDYSMLANYLSSSYNKPVKEVSLLTNQQGKVSFNLNIKESGAYYLQVRDVESGHQTGMFVAFENPGETYNEYGEGNERANHITITTDKKEYAPGETIHVTFPSSAESKAIVTVEVQDRILSYKEYACSSKETSIELKATAEMQPNAYVSVTLLNPYLDKSNDLPIRLYGVTPVSVMKADSKLVPVIKAPDKIRPGSSFTVSVSEQNGLPCSFTLAIVDEGLLDLTHFKTPSPWDAFFAKEALGVRTWDMYKYVMGAYNGKIEQTFSIGGDDALSKGPKAIVNRFKPTIIFKGPYTLKKGGQENIRITMPEYIGQVRCMVVAAGKQQYGDAQKDILVKQGVMVLGTLPRVLSPGDECEVPATVFAMEEGVGTVTLSLKTNNLFTVIGNNTQTVHFEKEGSQVVWFKVKAKKVIGAGHISIEATGKNQKSMWSADIEILSQLNKQTRISDLLLNPGESKTMDFDPFGLKGSNEGMLSVSAMKPLNLSEHISYLNTYPYRCIEQIVSSVFPNLYLPVIATFSTSEIEKMENDTRKVLLKMREYLITGGSFSYWPGSTSSDGWASVYAYHFLSQCALKGYVIPSNMLEQVRNYQAQIARTWKRIDSAMYASEATIQAYRLFVLASDNRADMGAMNRLKEISNLPLEAGYFLASAFALNGNNTIAKEVLENTANDLNNTGWNYIYGSKQRLESIQLITYLKMGLQKKAYDMALQIAETLRSSNQLNTQATSLSLIALANYYEKYPPVKKFEFSLLQEGRTEDLVVNNSIWNTNIDLSKGKQQVKITNKSKGIIYLQQTLKGITTQESQFESSNGILLTTKYVQKDAATINPSKLKQGTSFGFNVTVTNTSGVTLYNLMVKQAIPAGWEILNTRALTGDDKLMQGVSYQDYRDNQVLSYIPTLNANESVQIPVQITTSYAGLYYAPPTTCECMYDLNYYASTKGEWMSVIKQ